jgi:hypothetical protein
MRRAQANILNIQSRTADKGWFSSLWVGRGSNNTSPQNTSLSRNVTQDLGRPRSRWEDDTRIDLRGKNRVERCGLDASGSGKGPVADSHEHSNEPSDSIKGGKFLD